MGKLDKILKQYEYLQFSSAVLEGDYLWASAVSFNAIYKINIKSWETEYVCSVPTEKSMGKELYFGGIKKYKNKLYLIPGIPNRIAVFHIDSETFEYLGSAEMNCRFIHKFSLAQQAGRYLYLFPQGLNVSYILCLDMETDRMEKIYYSVGLGIEHVIPNEFFGGSVIGSKIWMAYGGCPHVIGCLDIQERKCSFYDITATDAHILDVAGYGGKLVLLTTKSEVLVFDPITQKSSCVWSESINNAQYFRVVCINGYIWLLPSRGGYIVRIGLKNQITVKHFPLPNTLLEWRPMGEYTTQVADYMIHNEKMYLFPNAINMLIIFDLEEMTMEGVILKSNRTDYLQKQFIEQEIHEIHYQDDLEYLIELVRYQKTHDGRVEERAT